ncbi:MAG: hypothetical protein R6V49_04485 [Bacteroidales bacterium]
MKKQLAIRLLGGFAALMLLNGLIRMAFDPSWYYGNDVLRIKMEQFDDHSEQYNTAMIGSSCIFWNLDPVLFDSVQPPEWDIRSFNFGSGGTTPPETYFILESLLSQNPPKVRFRKG